MATILRNLWVWIQSSLGKIYKVAIGFMVIICVLQSLWEGIKFWLSKAGHQFCIKASEMKSHLFRQQHPVAWHSGALVPWASSEQHLAARALPQAHEWGHWWIPAFWTGHFVRYLKSQFQLPHSESFSREPVCLHGLWSSCQTDSHKWP